MATTEKPEVNESTESEGVANHPSRVRSLLKVGLFVAGSLTLGLVLGCWVLGGDSEVTSESPVALSPADLAASSALRKRPEGEDEDSGSAKSPQAEGPDEGRVTIRQLHLMDILLTHGNVVQAMDSYSRMITGDDGNLNDQLVYRIAVAQELVGQLDNAGKLFRQLVAGATSRQMALAAQIGQARIWWKQDKPELTKASTARAVNALGADEPSNRMLLGDALHMLAFSHLPKKEQTDDWPYGDDHYIQAELKWSATHLLDLAREPESQPPSQPPSDASTSDEFPVPRSEELRILYRFGDHPSEVQLRIIKQPAQLRRLLEEITTLTGHQTVWSESALRTSDSHVAALRNENFNLSIAMDQLLATVGLSWVWRENQVHILGPDDLTDPVEARRNQVAAATRLLSYALANQGDSELAGYSELAMGNVHFEVGAYQEATMAFSKITERMPRSSAALVAQFNEAKSLVQLGQMDQAIELFFQVGDGGQGHPVQPVAYALAGKHLLEQGKSQEGVRPLLRAVSSSRKHAAIPALMLASAYTLAENHHASVQVLLEKREHILGTPYVPVADFLASLGRYRVATDDLAKTRRGRDVVQSIGNLDDVSIPGDHLHLILGDAFNDVGLSSQMESHFRRLLDKKVAVHIELLMRQRLADYYTQAGSYVEARQVLQPIADSKTNDASMPAKLQLARLEFLGDQPEDCLQRCRDLLDDELSNEQKADVLRLMGQVFQQQEHHYQAALCFAGMLPGEGRRLGSTLDRREVVP